MGQLIVVEGIDCSGKSTLVSKLADHFNCYSSGFPDRSTSIGQLINQVLQKKETISDKKALHLLFTANRFELQNTLKNMLLTQDIILDRYIYSGIAYSVAQGLDLEWCMTKEEGLLKADKVIYLDIDASVSASRKGFGDELYEKQQFLEKVVESFKTLIEEKWCIINANQSKDQVFEEACRFINSK